MRPQAMPHLVTVRRPSAPATHAEQRCARTKKRPAARFTPALLAFVLSLFSSQVQAGNDDGILVGSQAALTGGAVTATVSDGTAGWYNPAGLTQLKRHSLDINASVYGINVVSTENLFTLPDGTESGASVVDWVLVPSALAYSRRINERVVASFGIFVPKTTDLDLRTAVSEGNGRRWVVGIDQVENEYDYVASVGVSITDTLSIGAAVHGIYISYEENTTVGVGTPGSSSADFVTTSLHSTTGDYGLRLGLGVQWQPVPDLKLGFSMQTPTLTAYRDVTDTVVSSVAVPDSQIASFQTSRDVGLKSIWDASTPLMMRAGMATTIGNLQLLVDGSLTSSLRSEQEELARKWTGNLRLAVQYTFSERLAMGIGAFSDLTGNRKPDVDYVGLAGGVRLNRPFTIKENDRPLTFFTSLAGRYAYGFGFSQGIVFTGDGGIDGIEEKAVRIQAHEMAFNLGGGVTF
jgi:long-chain fatty acid transport protein